MKGDVIVIEEHHRDAARKIVPEILKKIRSKATRYVITVAGESGSGSLKPGRPSRKNWKNTRLNPFY